MLFNSWNFLIFFPIVVAVYCFVPRKMKAVWLLAASYYFYMCWNPRYIVLILFSTAATFFSGLGLEKIDREEGTENRRKRLKKIIVAGCFAVNLGILAFFKYFDFAVQNLNAILQHVGISVQNPFDFVLPVGISFFTFQALGYIVDVYRGEIEAEKNFISYALFVSFFPQLVAGPIERSKNLLADVKAIPSKQSWDFNRMTSGLTIMVYGMFLKLVLADRVSILVDGIFADFQQRNAIALWIGAAGFALQIYFDFAGYSTIAVGAARVMGFSLMENFNTPYFSRSIREFWRRWHISLSTWFKDYLYIPMGGNRCSRGRRYFNLMVTFLVSGFWHGAGWNYIAWGGLHGLYQIAGDLTRPLREGAARKMGLHRHERVYRALQTLCTAALVVIAWVFFRAASFSEAVLYLRRMFQPFFIQGGATLAGINFDLYERVIFLAALAVVFLVGLIKYNRHQNIDEFLKGRRIWVRWLAIYLLLFMIIIFGQYGPEYDAQAFIYFQF